MLGERFRVLKERSLVWGGRIGTCIEVEGTALPIVLQFPDDPIPCCFCPFELVALSDEELWCDLGGES